MPVVDVNGESIHFTDTGGDLPVVAFSHGLLMNAEMFEPQIEVLRSKYRCIAWDQRGHGDTGPAAGEFTYYDSADDLFALLTALGVRKAVLVGMSQGGYLSQRFALTHPELVAGLVLLATQAAVDDAATLTGYRALIDSWKAHGLNSVSDAVSGIILDPRSPVTAAWVHSWETFTPANLELIYHTLSTRDDVTPRLGEIRAPTMVIWGEQDRAIPEEHALSLADGVAGSELVRIPDVGHAVNLTHPQLVTPHIERFLNKVWYAAQ